MECEIHWKHGKKSLDNRILMFCLDEDCMSGRILSVTQLEEKEHYTVRVEFIEPKFFEGKAYPGRIITIREASTVLAAGKIVEA